MQKKKPPRSISVILHAITKPIKYSYMLETYMYYELTDACCDWIIKKIMY